MQHAVSSDVEPCFLVWPGVAQGSLQIALDGTTTGFDCVVGMCLEGVYSVIMSVSRGL
jgi:hypothetical protein